ncbi:MAG: hypothetical protein GXO59_03055 [Dictyoglomi bacterium]|jgi:predicted  nucleic acid-binding Zn-ribbon protein|nr:hypothetical protein [Dictyoglomota bacterium]
MGLMDNIKKTAETAGQKMKVLADIAKLTAEKKRVLTLMKKTYEDAGETIMSLYRDKRDAHALEPVLDDFLERILKLEQELRDIETQIAAKRREAVEAGVDETEIKKAEEA